MRFTLTDRYEHLLFPLEEKRKLSLSLCCFDFFLTMLFCTELIIV